MGGHYNDFGEWIDEPDPPPTVPPSPGHPGSTTQGNWAGSGAWWTDAKGQQHQNPWVSSDADYKRYTYDPTTGELRLRAGTTTNNGQPLGADPGAFGKPVYSQNAAPEGLNDLIKKYIQDNGLKANQSDPASLNKIVDYLRSQGYDVNVDTTDENGHTGGIRYAGQSWQLIDGSNNWTNLQPWDQTPSWDQISNSPLLKGFDQKFSFPDWQPPDPFRPPTELTEENDPGVRARLKYGQDTIESAAAARGTLLTGGTLRDLNQFAQDYASNEYGNVYNRSLSNYNTGRNASLTDWGTNYAKALQGYEQAYNLFSNNQANQFNRLSALSGAGQVAATNLGQMGSSAAGLFSNIFGNAASNLGGLYTGAGNAQAAGTVGSANAYNNMFGNIGNNAMNLGLLYGSGFFNPGGNYGGGLSGYGPGGSYPGPNR